jgi:hypothetical protein
MSDSESHKLQEYLTTLCNGLQAQTERTNNIEITLTIVHLAVNHLETQVNSQLPNLSTIQEAKHQRLNQTI